MINIDIFFFNLIFCFSRDKRFKCFVGDGNEYKNDVLFLKQAQYMANYLDALSSVERLHRLLLDVIKDEFERLGYFELNAVQALLLFNIGENEVTAGELKCSYYQRSNVTITSKIG